MTTGLNIDRNSNRTGVLFAAALLLGSAMAAGAQQTQLASSEARWTPWVGCWQASSRDAVTQDLAPNKALPVVCMVPAPGNAIDLVTVTGATANAPERIDANGTRRQVSREGCNGWETAEFSPDAKRVYLHSQHQCGNRTRTSSGIMSITPNGEWLDVQGVKVESNNGVRVVHYGRVPAPPGLSAEMQARIDGQNLASKTAVIAVSDSVKVADVIEASKKVDGLVVQTWLAQRGQGFDMNAKRLTQLADAKVPRNVIDVMVALSYPQTFAVNLAQADGQIVQTSGNQQLAEQEAVGNGPVVFMSWDPFYSSGYNYYGYGTRSLYGYGLGGNPWSGNWYTPVVIVRPNGTVNQENDTRGRMVKGSGYTRPPDRSGGGSSSSPRSNTSGGSSSGGSSSGGSRTSGTSGGETRTAKPRP